MGQRVKPAVPFVLVSLVLQNSGLAILANFSHREGAQYYELGSVVVCSEALKLLASLAAHAFQQGASFRLRDCFQILLPTRTKATLVVPSVLYVIQNTLQLFALKGLTPSVFIVLSQLKTLTTAAFSIAILKARLGNLRKVSILLLTFGVMCVQTNIGVKDKGKVGEHPTAALLALLLAVILSGLAGVLMEKSYKSEGDTIWVKNAFMALCSLPFAIGALVAKIGVDGGDILSGFDAVVWAVVALQALGGLIVAAVITHANNILKCFALSISIITCSVFRLFSGANEFTVSYLIGTGLVIFSVYLYSIEQRGAPCQKCDTVTHNERADEVVLAMKS